MPRTYCIVITDYDNPYPTVETSGNMPFVLADAIKKTVKDFCKDREGKK